MDTNHKNDTSYFSISFYILTEGKPFKYVYSLTMDSFQVHNESLIYYPSQQPATIFERQLNNGVSTIKFGQKIKISAAAKEEITLKCLSNMSVFAAYMQVNINILEIETVLSYFRDRMMPAIISSAALNQYAENSIKEEAAKDYILNYLKEADFNISDISSKERETKRGMIKDTVYQYSVQKEDGTTELYEFPELFESDGTIRTFGIAACIQKIIANDSFLAIDEIESSLHPKLIEYIIERFLRESNQAQLLLTTHYDGLLGQDDLLRKDNVWFTEKQADGATSVYPLTDFKGLNRISSLQKAYKFGKFGAVPNL